MKNRVVLVTILASLFAIIIVAVLFLPQFWNPTNLLVNVLVPASIVSILSLGMMFVMSGGGVDLSIGAIAGFCALVAIGTSLSLPVWLGVIIGILAGGLAGLMNGTVIAGLGISPFVITLGSTFIFKGLQYLVTSAASYSGMRGTYLLVPFSMMILGTTASVTLFFVTIFAAVFFVYELTAVGRRIQMIGANPNVSRLSGVHTRSYVTLTYIISGVLAAVAGILLSTLQGIARVGLGDDHQMDAFIVPLLAAAIFGRFSVIGTIMSAFIITALINMTTMLGMGVTQVQIAKGSLLLGIVLVVGIRKKLASAVVT